MKKIIDKIFRESIFEDKYFLRIEDTIKNFIQDIQVDVESWKLYNTGDEYNEK